MNAMIANLLRAIDHDEALFNAKPEDVPDVEGLRFAALDAEEQLANLRSEIAHANARIVALDDKIHRFQYKKKKSKEKVGEKQKREKENPKRKNPYSIDNRHVVCFSGGRLRSRTQEKKAGICFDLKNHCLI